MKTIMTILMASLLLFATAGIADKDHGHVSIHNGNFYNSDDISIDIDGSSVIIINDNEDDEIEITDKYELYINGDLIKTDKEQKKSLEQFHTQVMDIKDYAVDVGLEGAKIGLEGARIGVKAVGGVLKMIFTDYDEDDLDRDLERETEKIEIRAEELEDRAEEIEDMAEDLEDMFYDMEEDIPEVGALDW